MAAKQMLKCVKTLREETLNEVKSKICNAGLMTEEIMSLFEDLSLNDECKTVKVSKKEKEVKEKRPPTEYQNMCNELQPKVEELYFTGKNKKACWGLTRRLVSLMRKERLSYEEALSKAVEQQNEKDGEETFKRPFDDVKSNEENDNSDSEDEENDNSDSEDEENDASDSDDEDEAKDASDSDDEDEAKDASDSENKDEIKGVFESENKDEIKDTSTSEDAMNNEVKDSEESVEKVKETRYDNLKKQNNKSKKKTKGKK